jgi:hypothetical protein
LRVNKFTTDFLCSDLFLEPLLPTQPEEIADLSKQVSTPIALGERLYGRSDFRPYFEKRAIDIAQPDVGTQAMLSSLALNESVGFSLRRYQRTA